MTGMPEERRVIRFGRFHLDLRSGELSKGSIRVRLQEKPLRILELLLERPGDVVNRDKLRQALWPADTFVGFDGGLNTAVNKLRVALGDSAESPRFVETVGRRGYRFIGPVEPLAFEESPAAGDSPLEPLPPTAAARGRRRSRTVAAAALLALGAVTAWVVWPSPRIDAPGTIRSLAVLPLANLSGDADQDYLADGMTEALITELAGIRSLRVISRQSVMRYKSSRKPLPEIADELGVDAVVEGSVVREGQRVRISAQLLYAPGDRHIWAKSYERDLSNLLSLQGEMARTIAGAVHATLTPQERSRIGRTHSVQAEAYDLYLRGRYFFNRRLSVPDTKGTLQKAIGYLQQAVQKDPGFALAYAALAEAHKPLGYFGLVPPAEALTPMRANALRSLELDNTLAEAHNAMGACLISEWDWSGGEREHLRAIELNPGYPAARNWYSFVLIHMGRYHEALEQTEIGLESDPFNIILVGNSSLALARLGRHDEAFARVKEWVELEPQAQDAFGGLYLASGRYDEAITEFEKLGSKDGIAFARAAKGDGAALRELLRETQDVSKRRYVSPLRFAEIHVALGEKDLALAHLEEAYRTRVVALSRLKTWPEWDPLRPDPRFADLLRRLKLD